MKSPTLFHVAEYIRLSREDGDKAESDSIGNQRKLIADYLKDKKDFILYDTYIDDGVTGIHFNRPSFQRMVADIEAGAVNCVIVKDLSRFGRDYIDTGKYLERYFPEHGVRFISVTDHIDSLKRDYDMLLPIKNIFNEQYARDISQKVHASITTKQKAGEFIGAFASYGYQKSAADKNRLVIDEYAAGIVRRIFRLYINGYSKNRIAATLNAEGTVCPSEYKKRNGDNYHNGNRPDGVSYWTYSTINRILGNELYIGNMVQGRKSQRMRGRQRTTGREEWIVVQGTHKAIIDRETWDTVQDLSKRRTRSPDFHSNIGIFAGFLKCGDCGRALVKKGNRNYCCGTYVRSGRQYCTPHSIPHPLLEELIRNDLKTILQDTEPFPKTGEERRKATADAKQSAAMENETARLTLELEKVRKLKKAVYEDYRCELISKEEFTSYRQDYLQKEELLLARIAGMKGMGNTKRRDESEKIQTEEDTAKPPDNPWLDYLEKHRDIETLDRATVVEMLHEIKVYENHEIHVTYRFSQEERCERKFPFYWQ